jgi:hypothetical protein
MAFRNRSPQEKWRRELADVAKVSLKGLVKLFPLFWDTG